MDGELWDVTDAAGAPTGRTHRRGDPGFPDGMFHIVSAVCVVDADGLVLITRRAATKDWPLSWEFPAGSALAGETSLDAAVRELREETGLEVAAESLELIGRVTEESALLDFYVTRVRQLPDLALDPDEVCDAASVTLAEVHRRCDDGRMAGPWVERLGVLSDALARAVAH